MNKPLLRERKKDREKNEYEYGHRRGQGAQLGVEGKEKKIACGSPSLSICLALKELLRCA